MINRYKKMDKPKDDGFDRKSNLKGQVSRIYMNTIAANDREDRLLNEKLDALDIEHRVQFLRMKKIIRDARSFSCKKYQSLCSDKHRLYKEKKHHMALGNGIKYEKLDTPSSQRCTATDKPSRQGGDSAEGLASVKERPLGTRLFQIEGDNKNELSGRLQYTESEIDRMRKSWALQRAPKMRKRPFLPDLEKAPDGNLSSCCRGFTNTNSRRFQHRVSCYPQLLKGRPREDNPLDITASSLPKSLERRSTVSGNTTSNLRTLERESKSMTKSLSSNF